MGDNPTIALELAGNIAQVFMIWCDRAFKSRLSHSGFLVRLSKCYVDDINLAADEVHLSTRYEKGKLVVKEEAVDEDSLITSNKKTMEVVRKTGNSIHLLIQLEVYYPSNHEDEKMLILVLKV